MNIDRILVPVDFSDGTQSAIQYARSLGEKFSARLDLLHVLTPVAHPPDNLILTFKHFDTERADEAGKKLLAIAAALPKALEVEFHTIAGNPGNSIVEYAVMNKIDLIVMPKHSQSGLKHLLLGSTTERVARHAPCPVLMVPQPADTHH